MRAISDEKVRVDGLLKLEIKRLDDLRNDLHNADEKLQEARALSQKDLMMAEAKRIDALLAAAANAVGLASEKAAAQASALASQVVTSAEALRANAASAAAQNTEAMGVLRDAMDKRITLLEQNQYRGGADAEERREGRTNNQWLVGAVIAVVVVIVQIVLHFIPGH